MTLFALIANSTTEASPPGLQVALPILVGLVAGAGVIGFIHFVMRPRKIAAAPIQQKREKAPDPFVSGSGSEQRKAFRRKGNPIEVQVVDKATQGPPQRGYVLDRSVGGLGLQLDCPLEPTTHLTIRPTNAPHIAPWVDVVVALLPRGRGRLRHRLPIRQDTALAGADDVWLIQRPIASRLMKRLGASKSLFANLQDQLETQARILACASSWSCSCNTPGRLTASRV